MLALLLLRLVRFDVRQMLLVCRCSNDCGGVLLNPRDPFKGSASTFGENRRIAHAAILLQRCECLAENLLSTWLLRQSRLQRDVATVVEQSIELVTQRLDHAVRNQSECLQLLWIVLLSHQRLACGE